MRIRFILVFLPSLAPLFLAACIGGKGSGTNSPPPVPTVNTMAITVDSGVSGSGFNRAYATVKVCAVGSTTQCANIDHVMVDTGSFGLRLNHAALIAAAVTLTPEMDAQGQTIKECAGFGGGLLQTWGPVALADVTLAGEVAAKLPVQVLDSPDTATSPTTICNASGAPNDALIDFDANGVLGIGVLAQDLQQYYGCTAAGMCTAENIPLAQQVVNPITMFASDNNGVIVNLPALQNANGDATVQGELIFGLGTQPDNALPATGLTVLGADANGDFTAMYNGSTTVLPASFDSGTDSYYFDDPSIGVCGANNDPTSNPAFVGYYCPVSPPAPLPLSVLNTGAVSAAVPSISSPVSFALADPGVSFTAGAAAYIQLGAGPGATRFTWGMPFFYGTKVYFAIEQRSAGTLTGPFFAY